MSIDDSISNYSSEEKYISEFEEISKSKDITSEKCQRLFESCRTQFQGLALSGAPSPEQIKDAITFLKKDLAQKKTKLAKEIVQSGLNLLDPQVYKKFPPSLRFEIAKCFSEQKDSKLSEMIKAYEITDQNDVFELVKHKIEVDPIQTIREFESYGIADEQKRFELAKMFALDQGQYFYEAYEYFNISDPNNAFELAKIIALRNPEALTGRGKSIGRIIKDPEQRYEILRGAILGSLRIGVVFNIDWILDLIERLEITDRNQLASTVQLLAKIIGQSVLNHLDKFGITDANQIQLIYKSCYENAMKKFYLQGDKTTSVSLSFPNNIKWGFTPSLKLWLDRAIALNVPEQFETDAEKTKWEENFNNLLSDLIREGEALGISKSCLQGWMDKVLPKADSAQQRMKYLVWLGDFVLRCGFEPSLKPLLEDVSSAPTFEAVFKHTNPILQEAGTAALGEIYKNADKKKTWMFLTQGKPEHLLLTSLLLVHAEIPEKTSQKILESLKARRYLDYKLMQSINEMIGFLAERSGLPVQDQTRLLEITLNEPERRERESAKDYQKRVEEHRKNQEILLVAIPAFVLFGRLELIENIPDVKTLVSRWNSFAGELFGISSVEGLQKFNSIFCESKRYPNGLLLYAGRLQTLLKEEKLLLNEALGQFARSVIDGTFPQIRYDFAKNPHLKTVFEKNPVLFEKWKTALAIPLKTPQELIVQDTDEWEDLLLLGTEVSHSCQSLGYDPKYNKCLLSYVLDGKNRAIVVKNKQGKIVARSVLRILWDPQKKEPVLFMEKLYTSQNNPALDQMVWEGCQQKARAMDLPLVVAGSKDFPGREKSPIYPGVLESLGGPVPFEYVDAVGGVHSNGKFTIPESRVIYDPKA